MTANPYKVLGLEPAAMLGRAGIFQRLMKHLVKEVPDHVSVVGPKHYGKTVILSHLANSFDKPDSPFLCAIHWDLRHGTPEDNDQFLKELCHKLGSALRNIRPDIDYLDPKSSDVIDFIDLCLEDLEEHGDKILTILDGFDHVLSRPGISRELWDSLRSFAQRRSLVLVTGSRNNLRELCRSEDSRTSDFWEIFYDSPIQVQVFEEQDWPGLLEAFDQRGISFDTTARKEIANWTGGSPLLVIGLLRNIWDQSLDETELSKAAIDTHAEEFLVSNQNLTATLWDDCPLEMQSDLVRISERGFIPANKLDKQRQKHLFKKGFVTQSGGKIKCANRLMEKYAAEQSKGVDDIRRLFEDETKFVKNIKAALEIRLSQVQDGDADLKKYVLNAVRDLAEPKEAVVWARRIAEQALDMIWARELQKDRTYPPEWIEEWKHAGEKLPQDAHKLPQARGAQCNVLRLMTGTQKARKVSRHISKSTYLLVDHIQSIGDYGQHQDDEASAGFAASFCFAAVALFESLAREM